jgi:hypothetical protein
MLRRLSVAIALLALMPATAMAGTVALDGGAITYTGDDGVDSISVFETADAIHFASIGATSLNALGSACTAASQGQSVICPKPGVTSVGLALGGGDDLAAVAPDLTLPVTIDCGDGQDTAISDDTEVSCERTEAETLAPVATPVAPAEVVDLDRDDDGVARPQDCDDANAAIRPGAREVRGNRVDENCDTRIEPFPPLLGSVSVRWAKAGDATRNLRLTARKFLRGATVEVRCIGGGCPSRTFTRTVRSSSENLQSALGSRVIRRGARLEVRVTSPSRIGRMLRFRFGKAGQPDVDFLCLPPGGGTRDC